MQARWTLFISRARARSSSCYAIPLRQVTELLPSNRQTKECLGLTRYRAQMMCEQKGGGQVGFDLVLFLASKRVVDNDQDSLELKPFHDHVTAALS